jgi:hypothetical protein
MVTLAGGALGLDTGRPDWYAGAQPVISAINAGYTRPCDTLFSEFRFLFSSILLLLLVNY